MIYLVVAIFSFNVLVFLWAMIMFARNDRVYRLRSAMIEKVYSYPDWQWRQAEFHKVTYREVAYKFWKPVTPKAFYDDVSFLEPSDMPVRSPIQLL